MILTDTVLMISPKQSNAHTRDTQRTKKCVREMEKSTDFVRGARDRSAMDSRSEQSADWQSTQHGGTDETGSHLSIVLTVGREQGHGMGDSTTTRFSPNTSADLTGSLSEHLLFHFFFSYSKTRRDPFFLSD